MNSQETSKWHGTTILCVRIGDTVAMGADGQVTMGNVVAKHSANKLRILAGGKVIVGFAGVTADALTLYERLESMIERFPHQLTRACVELAKEWRTDRALRRLEAMLIVCDNTTTLMVSGNGDVFSPDDDAIAIGSGGNFALSAALALLPEAKDATEVVRKSMDIAAKLCIYTNNHINIKTLPTINND